MANVYTDQQVTDALAALTRNNGALRPTARELGIPLTTLVRWSDEATGRVPVQVKRDYGALWARGQDSALSAAEEITARLQADIAPERQAENLRAVVGYAHMGAQHHLDYTVGRTGAQTQVNVDARQQTDVHVDNLITAVMQARSSAINEQQTHPALIEGTATEIDSDG